MAYKETRVYTPIFCDPDVRREIEQDARNRRASISQVIREVLYEHYKQRLQEGSGE